MVMTYSVNDGWCVCAGLAGPANPLVSGAHLQHLSHMSDDEPLYDSVASDDDYAALAPLDFDVRRVRRLYLYSCTVNVL